MPPDAAAVADRGSACCAVPARDVDIHRMDPAYWRSLAVPWDEAFTLPRERSVLVLDADSYASWTSRMLPQLDVLRAPHDACRQTPAVELGDGKHLLLRRLPAFRHPLRIPFLGHALGEDARPHKCGLPLDYAGRHRVTWSDDVDIPMIVDAAGEAWMSLTPAEVLAMRALARHGRGRVLVGGLGLGYLVELLLRRAEVEHVTVVEIDPAIVRVIGDPLRRRLGGKRLEILAGDVYAQDPRRYDRVLVDIWQGPSDWRHDEAFAAWRRGLDHVHAWGVGTRHHRR